MSGLMVQGHAIFRNITKYILKNLKKIRKNRIKKQLYFHSYKAELMVQGLAIFGNILKYILKNQKKSEKIKFKKQLYLHSFML